MNLDSYNLDVDFNKETGLLMATLTVPQIPKVYGVRGYNLEEVLVMLKDRGFELTASDCVSKTVGTVRTHNVSSSKGIWTFKLVADKPAEPKVKLKPAEPKVKLKPAEPKVNLKPAEPKAKLEPEAKPEPEEKKTKTGRARTRKSTTSTTKKGK